MTETSVCIEQEVFAEGQDKLWMEGKEGQREVSWFQWLTNGRRRLRTWNKQIALEVTCVPWK